MTIWQRIMSWFSFYRRHDDADAERAAFLHDDRQRRHELANEVQAMYSRADEQQVRVNQLRAEQNALFGVDLGHRHSADDRGGGDAGHAGA